MNACHSLVHFDRIQQLSGFGNDREARILLIDDHPDTRELYMQVLELAGFATYGAGDGFEGWEMAKRLAPDVIVTDVGLPKMDGIELCARLKADAATSRIPILALTGFGEAAVADRARSLGIAKVLVKPCAPDLLIEEIRGLCSSGDAEAPS